MFKFPEYNISTKYLFICKMSIKLRLIQLLALLAYLNLAKAEGMYTLVLHSYERGASCLDGSPAGLYYHEGSGKNKNKFMIYFNSGGFCEGLTLE